ncbi:hypothetical protein ACQ4LE_008908 [Meloidogyne hapla]
MSQLKQRKIIPIELLVEIFKATNTYPKDLLNKIVIEKIKLIFKNLSTSSRLFYTFSGKFLKEKMKIAMAANDITLKEEIKKELKEEFQTKISSIETKLSEVQKQLCQVLEEKGNLKNYKNKKLDISKKSVTIRKKGPKLLFNSDQKQSLLAAFERSQFLDRDILQNLLETTGLREEQIRSWFRKKRFNSKNQSKGCEDAAGPSNSSASATPTKTVKRSSFSMEDILKSKENK